MYKTGLFISSDSLWIYSPKGEAIEEYKNNREAYEVLAELNKKLPKGSKPYSIKSSKGSVEKII